MKSHKDLDVWKTAVELAEKIYALTGAYPKSEQFGMTSQMRRSSVSIPSNIAEGAGRQGNKEFVQYLHYSLGSAAGARDPTGDLAEGQIVRCRVVPEA